MTEANNEIDISTINFQPLDELGAAGKKPPVPTGLKIDVLTIGEFRVYPPHPDSAKKGVTHSLRVPLTPAEGSKYKETMMLNVAYKEGGTPHGKSTWFALNAAVWPKMEDRVGKVPTDWIGEQIAVMTVPDTKPDGEPYTKIIPMPLGA
jgi:hypothetical protein